MVEKLEKTIGSFEKGQFISPEIIENILGEQRTSPSYQFGSMKLVKDIKKHMSDHGIHVTVISESYGIRILTDSEASAYNTKRYCKGLEIIERSYDDAKSVDANNLTKEEEEIHNKRLVFIGRGIDSIKQEYKKDIKIPLGHYKNNLPRMLK
jgi:hypothetical protein